VDINLFDRVSTRVAERMIEAADKLAEIYRGDPKLIRKLERKTFNEMTEAKLFALEQLMGKNWVMELMTRLQGQRR
jgi:hypothetical protein